MKITTHQITTGKISLFALLVSLLSHPVAAQEAELHVNPRWKECSFQLDPTLSQQEWRQFTREAGLVACFRPLTSARPIGQGRVEISLLQWKTAINESKGAWNNTFVHPHSEHYLVGGPNLSIPGLSLRAGISKKLDAGLFWTTNPGANYSFAGAQLQYNILSAEKHKIDVSSRLGLNVLYGPEDVDLAVYAVDVLVSKKFIIYRNWLSLSPYAGCSGYLTRAHEKTDRVHLHDETIEGVQGIAGLVTGIKNFQLGLEYNLAAVNTFSFRLGYQFKLWQVKNKPS